MKIHSDIIIYELLKLNFYLTNSPSINITNLKNAFYEILDIIEQYNSININFNFETELQKFLESYEEFITHDKNTITLDISIIDFLAAILEFHNQKLSDLDYKISDYVLKPKICLTLGLKIPFESAKELVYLNSLILRRYLQIGEKDFKNIPPSLEDFSNLSDTIKELNELLNNIDNCELAKLQICWNTFNNEFLSNKDELFINAPWNIILFSYNPKRFHSLRYDRGEQLTSFIDEKDDESDEPKDSNNSDIEVNPNLEDIPLFLTYFLIFLNNYLKTNPNSPAKEALIIKKYLLISIHELSHIESYFLENHTLDNFLLPSITDDTVTETTFEELKNKVIACTISLNINDTNALTYPHLYATIITCALFIKTYLTLSINPNSKDDIIDLIINSMFYKKPHYKIATTIVDNIIFSANFNLTK